MDDFQKHQIKMIERAQMETRMAIRHSTKVRESFEERLDDALNKVNKDRKSEEKLHELKKQAFTCLTWGGQGPFGMDLAEGRLQLNAKAKRIIEEFRFDK